MVFLIAAVLLVPLSGRLGLGAVLGYLLGGVLIGPSGFGVVSDVGSILHISEFGIVLLLFLIGLELQPSRLWVLRRQVFGLGAAQLFITGIVIAAAAWAMGLSTSAAIVAGFGLAMSSTAFVMQTLAEKNQLSTRHGREAFAILLLQDLAVIPLLALVPLLGQAASVDSAETGLQTTLKATIAIGLAVVASRTLVRPLLRAVINFGGREIFTAAALLLVIGMAEGMVAAGLSASLGAFLAGVLLADSEYRHQLEATIAPFKGLLMGLFFMGVGMSTNIGLLSNEPFKVLSLVLLLMFVKIALLFVIGLIKGSNAATARKLGIALGQGGEFAFVLFSLAFANQIFNRYYADLLMVVVSISMLLSPLLIFLDEKLAAPRLDREAKPDFDKIDVDSHPVIIAGFGRVGQVVSRILYMRRIPFTAVDNSPHQVDFVRKFGNKIYYGDPSHLDLLYAAKVDQAKLFVLAVDDVEASIKTAEIVRQHFPHVPIYARARNRYHCYKLMDLGVKMLVRETFLSSIALSAGVLRELGLEESDVEHTVTTFREFDENSLLQQHAVYQDEEKLMQSTRQATEDLKDLFESAPAAELGVNSGNGRERRKATDVG